METEKSLIVYSSLALIIGVCSILPLGIIMTSTAKAEALSEPWFDIQIPYAYIETNNGTLTYTDPGVYNPFNETNTVTEQHLIALNFTLNTDLAEHSADARIEYFIIELSSDKEDIGTINWFVGTKTQGVNITSDSFHFMRDEWFDTDMFSADDWDNFTGVEVEGRTVGMDSGTWSGSLMSGNWTTGHSIIFPELGHKSGTIGNSPTSKIVTAIREAETLQVRIQRIGWVTFTGNSTEVMLPTSENDLIAEVVQLEKFENGFLYNTLIPEDKLSAVIDWLHPISFEDLNP